MINRILFKAFGVGPSYIRAGHIGFISFFLVTGACNPGSLLEDGRGGGYKQ